MKRILIVLFSLLVSISTLAAAPVTQVSDINAPWRNPYQHRITFTPNPTDCPNNLYCIATFPAVPAGKRLVVTNVSTQYSLTTPVTDAAVSIGVDGSLLSDTLDLPAPVKIGDNDSRFVASASITYFVESGHSPTVILQGTYVTPVTFGTTVSITGYLVSVP